MKEAQKNFDDKYYMAIFCRTDNTTIDLVVNGDGELMGPLPIKMTGATKRAFTKFLKQARKDSMNEDRCAEGDRMSTGKFVAIFALVAIVLIGLLIVGPDILWSSWWTGQI